MKRAGANLVLALLVSASVAATGLWMDGNGFLTRPPPTDGAWYRLDALRVLRALEQDGLLSWARAGLEHDRSHPPLLIMVAALIGSRHGEVSPADCWMAVGCFFVALGFGIHALARRFGDARFALAATAIALSAPVTSLVMRPFNPNGPMFAPLVWTLAALLSADGFRRRGWSVATGLLAGIATMTKMLAPLYLLGSVAAALVIGLRDRTARPRVAWNAALSLVAAAAVCLPWYGRHWRAVFDYSRSVVGEEGQRTFSQDLGLANIHRWAYYPMALVNQGLTVPLAAVTLVAAFVVCRRRRSAGASRNGLILGWGLLVAWIVVTIGQVAGNSIYFAHVPALAGILVASWVRGAGSVPGRRLACIAVIATCAFGQYAALRPFNQDRLHTINPVGPFELMPRFEGHLPISESAAVECVASRDAEPWPAAEYAVLMASAPALRVPRVTVAFADRTWFNPYVDFPIFEYEMELRGRSLEHVSFESLAAGGRTPTPDELDAWVRDIDFAIVDHRGWLTRESVRAILDHARVRWSELDYRVVTRTPDGRPAASVGLYRVERN